MQEEEEEEEDWRLSELALFFFAQFGDGLFKEKEAQSIEGILVMPTKNTVVFTEPCEGLDELLTLHRDPLGEIRWGGGEYQ